MLDLNPQKFRSRILGQDLTSDTAYDISADDLDDVSAEVGTALCAINARIKTACGVARSTGRHMPAAKWADMQAHRSFLAALHQQLLTMRGRRTRQERDERIATQEQDNSKRLPDLTHYFQQVVRNEARPVDYQRWVLQAEMRRTADANRERKQGDASQ